LTQEQIDRLVELKRGSNELNRLLGKNHREYLKLRRQCDYEYSDGSDACTYDADGKYCEICKRLI
jgi:hypothetical protein